MTIVDRDFNYYEKIYVSWNDFGQSSSDGYAADVFFQIRSKYYNDAK